MAEFINRDNLQKSMEFVTNDMNCPLHIAAYIDQIIAQEPAADVEEVRHEHWIVVRDNNNYPVGLKCSGCGRKVRKRGENYCPECGAKMEGFVI